MYFLIQTNKKPPGPRYLAFLLYYSIEPRDETLTFCLVFQRLVVKSHQDSGPISKLNVL